ncbi:MAG: M3 family oligoendopeptidase [Anaerolineae bacterium]
MSFPAMPSTVDEINPREWETFRPYFEELQQRPLSQEGMRRWLEDWSKLSELIWEAGAMIYIEKSLDTTDAEREQAFLDFIDQVQPKAQVADQALKERLLANEAAVNGMSDMKLVLRNIRNETDLFRENNIPLLTELAKLDNEYDKATGGLKADWDGEEKNLSQLTLFLREKDRAVRTRAWKTIMALWLEKRETLNKIYANMLALRRQVAANAGLPNYRAYAFRDKGRFDYTPEDCFTFHDAIEKVVVPAALRIYDKKRTRLHLDALRPWDVEVDASDAPPLQPYQKQEQLITGAQRMFKNVDPELGSHFSVMAAEKLLDLDTRQGKALGGYCSTLPLRKRPFIFMNGVGIHDNVQTLLHEAGHAFHVFETASLPLVWHLDAPMEFCEVASMAMELLAAPYLTRDQGGFYTESEAARARIEHLEGIILFLPYMAVVDAFQHWVYTHADEAMDAANCDAAWDKLWARFMPGVSWEGYEDSRMTGWHRKPHIFGSPFYYIEYGMAQVGALQVWRNSLKDQASALAAYRRALSLGGTRTLPELFAAAGAEFRFDSEMLTDLVALVEKAVDELETVT